MAFFSLKFAYQVVGLFGLNFRLGSQFAVPAMAAAGHYWPVDFFNLMAATNLKTTFGQGNPFDHPAAQIPRAILHSAVSYSYNFIHLSPCWRIKGKLSFKDKSRTRCLSLPKRRTQPG